MTQKLAFIFPGQGSQSVGMLSDYAEQYSCVAETFAEASEVVGYDMWKLVANGPVEELKRTEVTQPVMLVAGVAVWRAWQANNGPVADLMAGHSLGEYTALVCSNAIALKDAVKLVQLRGRYMQESVPEDEGAMAAIIGLANDVMRDICEKASEGEVVSCANFNSPGQVVIGGNIAAVERATALVKEAGARVIPVAMSAPSHCMLMKPAADRLAEELTSIAIGKPNTPIINNVDGRIEFEPAAIKDALIRQVFSPVDWVSVIQKVASLGATHVLECGPGKVLSGLNKRIDKGLVSLPMLSMPKFENALSIVGMPSEQMLEVEA